MTLEFLCSLVSVRGTNTSLDCQPSFADMISGHCVIAGYLTTRCVTTGCSLQICNNDSDESDLASCTFAFVGTPYFTGDEKKRKEKEKMTDKKTKKEKHGCFMRKPRHVTDRCVSSSCCPFGAHPERFFPPLPQRFLA